MKGKNMSTKKIKPILALCSIMLFGIFLTACNSNNPAQSSGDSSTGVPIVSDSAFFHAEGKVVPKQYATLSFPIGGQIGKINVTEGQSVSKDAVLMQLAKTEQVQAGLTSAQKMEVDAQVTLDDLNKKADLDRGIALQDWRSAEKELLDYQVVLNDLDTKDYQDDLGDLEDDVQDAKDDLDDAQDELDKYSTLDPSSEKRKNAQEKYDDKEQDYLDAVYKRDLLMNELSTAKGNVEAAKAKVDDAKRIYDDRQKGPDPDKLKQAQAALDDARAQVAAAKRAVADTEITAPFDSVVVDLFHLVPGSTISVDQSAVEIADFSSWYVETKDLTELDVVKIKEGDLVELSADALPGQQITGTVESIQSIYGEYSGDIVYTVRIKLSQPVEGLRWGMTVDVRFSDPVK